MATLIKALDFKKVVLPTILDYLVICLPVVFYVGLESLHKGALYFIISPEWAILNIFLGFQSIYLYIRHLNLSNKRPNFDFLGIMILGLVTITLISTVNASASLHHNTTGKIILRILLLILSSILFFLLVFASKTEKTA